MTVERGLLRGDAFHGAAVGGRSSFWDFPDRAAAVNAIIDLTENHTPVDFVILGIFDHDDTISVYFKLAVGELIDYGDVINDAGISVHVGLWYEGELEFHHRVRALGGTYTGS